MRTLYFDCQMGAAGDMLTAALLELIPDRDQFVKRFNALGIPGVVMKAEPSEKCGVRGTHVSIIVNGEEEESQDHEHDHHHEHAQEHHHDQEHGHDYAQEHHHDHPHDQAHDHDHTHDHEHTHDHDHDHGGHHHHHSGLSDIEHIIKDHIDLPENVQKDILAVYQIIAEAESQVHGVPMTEIHFHEVGTMDAVADVAAVCMLMNELKPERVVASPVHVGSGQVKCAHGILPVPAPATALILQDVPIYSGEIKGELCTPTGAALLKYFVDEFGQMPLMKTTAIGYGMGKKDFPAANCVRAMLGNGDEKTEELIELTCNVDDMTAEAIGFAMEQLFAGGARDVYTIPVGMKKNRPGILIHVMCSSSTKAKMVELLFKHTTTLGIREAKLDRYFLHRSIEEVDTPFGKVHIKKSHGYGVERAKYEYEDLARIAREEGLSLAEVEKRL